MEKKLEDMTILELKALAFDELRRLDQVRNNLTVLNAEIAKRESSQEPQIQ